MPPYRDYQRGRVYAADQCLYEHGREFSSLGEVQTYVDDIRSGRWFRKRWPTSRSIKVQTGRSNRKSAEAIGDVDGLILLPPDFWIEFYVLHEMSHLCTAMEFGDLVPGHGAEFCSIYLELVRRQMGNFCWRLLRDNFLLRDVDHDLRTHEKPTILGA
jgi:putative metallohydrolase (TIGR04338 family)